MSLFLKHEILQPRSVLVVSDHLTVLFVKSTNLVSKITALLKQSAVSLRHFEA
jgi:hypothetical protein